MPTRQLHEQIAIIILLNADSAARTPLPVCFLIEFHDWKLQDLLLANAWVLVAVDAPLLHEEFDHLVEGVGGAGTRAMRIPLSEE